MSPRKEEVTLKDIAEAVGKSVAAVSRALNNHDDISEETREYIKQVAREMGYAPTNTLGLILPAFHHEIPIRTTVNFWPVLPAPPPRANSICWFPRAHQARQNSGRICALLTAVGLTE
ncbi:MAG: LacI family DNA-binding transcriptional regulator [Anaerolineales bacterium]|nr:LacI family DNA-binding transcriptional regulator [Anaerolineales bacterium]